MVWPIEEIEVFLLDGRLSLLYYRIHITYKRERNPSYKAASAFKYSEEDEKMSTNWNKYSDAERSRLGAKYLPEFYGVVSFIVKKVREAPNLDKLEIEHAPKDDNRAHTNINGLPKYEQISEESYREVQVLLARMAEWEIPFK